MALMPSPRDLHNHTRTPSELDDLAYGPNRERIVKTIDSAVRKTMAEDRAPQVDDEYRYRARKAWAMVQALRYELHWSIFKICDRLAELLRMDLNGTLLEPDAAGRSWWGEGQL